MTKPSIIRYARIALLAMLWQILAMPLSNVLAMSGGIPGEAPVCTASGIKWIKLSDAAPAQNDEVERRHCPLCVPGQGSPALVHSHAAINVPVSPAQETTLPVLETLHPVPATGAPPPARAPPSIS